MIKTISTAFAAFAVVTFAGLSGQATAQNCQSCGSGSNSFSYPVTSSSCGRGGCLSRGHGHGVQGGGHFDELKNQINHQSALNAKSAARNDAWPLPFACQDKRTYYETWAPMLAAGRETQGVLDSKFFTENNELNRIGIERVQEIAMNSPVNERSVYVSRTGDQAVDQIRVDATRNTIATYYSHRGVVGVRLSDRTAPTISGAQILATRESYNENRPPATIFEAENVNETVSQ